MEEELEAAVGSEKGEEIGAFYVCVSWVVVAVRHR